MKILCVIDCLGSGGSQRQIVEIALGFKELGHEVSFLTYHPIKFYDPILIAAGISIDCLENSNYLVRLFKMRRFIRKGKYDGVLAFLEGPCFICEFAGIPYKKWKLTVSEGSANPQIFKSFKHILFRFFHVFADNVVSNSYTNMRMVRKINPFLPKSTCRVIYNIIDFEKWKPADRYIPRMNGKLQMIVVASHGRVKNLYGLSEALALLSDDDKNKIHIHWYGDKITEPYFNNSYPEAKQKIAALGLDHLITFHPATHPIIQKIREADMMGLFSLYEGLPNVVCEAMACQKPLLCTAVSDLPDILSHEPNLLCDPTDAASIAQALHHAISLSHDELVRIGRKNEEIAKALFDKKKNIASYLQLFQS